MFLSWLCVFRVSITSQKSMNCSFLCSPFALSPLHETGLWICWPLAFASYTRSSFYKGILLPACTCSVLCPLSCLVLSLALCHPSHFHSNATLFIKLIFDIQKSQLAFRSWLLVQLLLPVPCVFENWGVLVSYLGPQEYLLFPTLACLFK